jgi:hypothetical protein
LIPAFDLRTGALPPGNHQATLELIVKRFGFTPRRRWLLKGLRAAVEAFWAAGIQKIYIDGSFCTEKPDPGDIDGYWVEPDEGVHDRIDPYWIDFEPVSGSPCEEMEVANVGRLRRLSSSFIRRCKPARKWVSRNSSGRIGTVNRAV